MPKALDQDLRDRVIDAVLLEGMSRRGAAARFGVSVASAIKWVHAARVEDRRHPVGTGDHRPSALRPVQNWLLAQIELQPDVTLEALCARLWEVHRVRSDTAMMSRFFRKTGISFKKNALRRRAGQT